MGADRAFLEGAGGDVTPGALPSAPAGEPARASDGPGGAEGLVPPHPAHPGPSWQLSQVEGEAPLPSCQLQTALRRLSLLLDGEDSKPGPGAPELSAVHVRAADTGPLLVTLTTWKV